MARPTTSSPVAGVGAEAGKRVTICAVTSGPGFRFWRVMTDFDTDIIASSRTAFNMGERASVDPRGGINGRDNTAGHRSI